MNDFTASNGIGVEINDEEQIVFAVPNRPTSPLWMKPDELGALREFFRAEEDERLGRWRSVANPAWMAVVSDNPNGAVVFRHEDGERGFMVCDRDESLTRLTSELQAVAREYFTLIDGVFRPITMRAFFLPVTNIEIESGRRIWPEVSS